MEGRGRCPTSSGQSAAGRFRIGQSRPTRSEGAWLGAEAPPAAGAREPMGERPGRGPAGGTCGRARVRVGPQQPGWDRDGNNETGTNDIGNPISRQRDSDTGTCSTQEPHPDGAEPPLPMESPPRACSCGSPTSDSEAEGGGPLPTPPKPEHGCKRLGGPGSPPSPCTGKRPRKGEGGKPRPPPLPSDADRLFAQKCQELGGFIQPLEELLEGLKRGRYHRGLSSFQQSVAMDRLQRIIGVLQKPEMGARYLATLLQVEGMLRVWFPHVTPKPGPPAPPPPRRRRRPPAAPRCRRPSPRSATPDA